MAAVLSPDRRRRWGEATRRSPDKLGLRQEPRDTAELMLGQHSGPIVIAAGTVAYLQGKTASHGKD